MAAERSLHVLVLAPEGTPELMGSYGRAFKQLGHRVSYWSPGDAVQRYVRGERLGRKVHEFLPVETWVKKGNRDLIIEARRLRPDMILVGGASAVRAGALAQIKAALPSCNLVLVWPDTLLNLAGHVIEALPLYDLVASYSEGAVPLLERLGAPRVRFVPFAVDAEMLAPEASISDEQRARFDCDVVFVGNHRPERERAVVALLDSGLRVAVWGGDVWRKQARDKKKAARYFRGGPAVGAGLGRALRCAKVGLNVIDDTNFPAANMRFFEGLGCGSAMLSSACPEMSRLFRDGETVVYYDGELELVRKAHALVGDDAWRARVAAAGLALASEAHQYTHRAHAIVEALDRV